ncbi:hypothetical protein Ancab_014161 [Ancistrocladus abbreviatus]
MRLTRILVQSFPRYGCVGLLPEADSSSNSGALGNLSVETLEKGLLTPKSNVLQLWELFYLRSSPVGRIPTATVPRKRGTWSSGAGHSYLTKAGSH